VGQQARLHLGDRRFARFEGLVSSLRQLGLKNSAAGGVWATDYQICGLKAGQYFGHALWGDADGTRQLGIR
jgi:hypothetical protein